jgi:hypothetical protein
LPQPVPDPSPLSLSPLLVALVLVRPAGPGSADLPPSACVAITNSDHCTLTFVLFPEDSKHGAAGAGAGAGPQIP